MKTQLKTLACASLLTFNGFCANAQEKMPAHIGLVYPISTHGTKAAQYINHLSIHALSGVSAGEEGFALYGVAGIVRGDGAGFLSSGVATVLQGELQGVQLSGVFNKAANAPGGVQLAGVANFNQGAVPIQLAGVINQTKKAGTFQSAGVVNIAQQQEGVQIAGIANTTKASNGIQIAGVANVTHRVDGLQVAGVVNRAKVVRGVQIAGLLNIADSSDYPIGVINLIKNGEKRIGLSTDENLTSLVTFRSGGQKLYGIIGLGANPQYDALSYGFEAGLGIKLLEGAVFRLDMEAVNLYFTNFKGSDYSKSGIRLLPALALSKKLQLYGGPSINYMNIHDMDGSDLAKISLWERYNRNIYKSIHMGYVLGIQVQL